MAVNESYDELMARLKDERRERLCDRLSELGLDERAVAYALRKSKADSLVDVTRYFLPDGEAPKRDVRLYRAVREAIGAQYERACSLPLIMMSLPGSARMVFERLDVRRAGELVRYSTDVLLSTKYCGVVTLNSIEESLAGVGLWLAQSPYGLESQERKLIAPVEQLELAPNCHKRLRKEGLRTVGDVYARKGEVRAAAGSALRLLDVAMARHGLDYIWSD